MCILDSNSSNKPNQNIILSTNGSATPTTHSQQRQPLSQEEKCSRPIESSQAPDSKGRNNVPMSQDHQCPRRNQKQFAEIAEAPKFFGQKCKEHELRSQDENISHTHCPLNREAASPYSLFRLLQFARPNITLRYNKPSWTCMLLLAAANSGVAKAQDDCTVLNAWLPDLVSSSGCCAQPGLEFWRIQCNAKGRVTRVYASYTNYSIGISVEKD
jgi:hypothetical protein